MRYSPENNSRQEADEAPVKPIQAQAQGLHWSEAIFECIAWLEDPEADIVICGGSEHGQFPVIKTFQEANIRYFRRTEPEAIQNADDSILVPLAKGALVLEIGGRRVAGFTSYDVTYWLKHAAQPITFKLLPPGVLTNDLSLYLSRRFSKGSLDHELQDTIRDNIYLRTVPCTTRRPRPGEVNNVDYRFISIEQFLNLEKGNELLESGIFEGNYYGTPKPPLKCPAFQEFAIFSPQQGGGGAFFQEPPAPRTLFSRFESNDNINSSMPPTQLFVPEPIHPNGVISKSAHHDAPSGATAQAPGDAAMNRMNHVISSQPEVNLGPLPPNWESAVTEFGEQYFIDHNTGTTHWTDPRLGRPSGSTSEAGSSSSSGGADLPVGWEKINDPQYGVYYVDHINKTTQYEKPTCTRYFFTRNPDELTGSMVQTRILKGPKGLGFTLVGNDDGSVSEEFLQIKNVIPGGSAFKDGVLRIGDVLVYINETCVLGFTQSDIIQLLQAVPIGSIVSIRACRGYPFLVSGTAIVTENAYATHPPGGPGKGGPRPPAPAYNLAAERTKSHFTTAIRKGAKGFGFTIADCPFGQRIKNVLDSERCGELREHDILLGVNGRDLTQMNHGQVVEFLREFPSGELGNFLVQRPDSSLVAAAMAKGLIQPQNTNLLPALRVQQQPPHPSRPLSYHQGISQSESTMATNTKPGFLNRRAKTPTNELRAHAHAVLPPLKPRSKTPGPGSSSDRVQYVAPPRPPVKANGHLPTGHHQQMVPPAKMSPNGAAIYENFANLNKIRGGSKSTHNLSGHMKESSAGHLTPDYVPASVWKGALGSTGGTDSLKGTEMITVNLLPKQNGFGFRLVGGMEEGTQVCIGQIMAGGAAAIDGRLKSGDRVVKVNGSDTIGATHAKVISLMNQANEVGHVKLLVSRQLGAGMSRSLTLPFSNINMNSTNVVPASSSTAALDPRSQVEQHQPYAPHQPRPEQPYQQSLLTYSPPQEPGGTGGMDDIMRSGNSYDVTVHRRPNEGFGFVILSSVNKSGSTIGRIIPGSPAARCGHLNVGDRIISVNGQNILNMHHTDIVNLIRVSGNSVTLTVDPVHHPGGATTGSSVGSISDDQNLAFENSFDSNLTLRDEPSNQQPTLLTAELTRGSRGYGFSIRGGQEFGNMPLFVLRIAEGGPAHQDGRMQVGDQLLEINGKSATNMTHAEAIELIRTQPRICLKLHREPPVPRPNSMRDFVVPTTVVTTTN